MSQYYEVICTPHTFNIGMLLLKKGLLGEKLKHS